MGKCRRTMEENIMKDIMFELTKEGEDLIKSLDYLTFQPSKPLTLDELKGYVIGIDEATAAMMVTIAEKYTRKIE